MTIYRTSHREDTEQAMSMTWGAGLDLLVGEQVITREQADEQALRWTPVLIPKRSILETLWALLFKNEQDGKETFLIRFAKIEAKK